jgi:hypothetical protein
MPDGGVRANITGGLQGFVGLELATEEVVTAGSYKDYELYLAFSDFNSAYSADPRANILLYNNEKQTTVAGGGSYAEIAGSNPDTNMLPSFIWSDNSASGTHTELSRDFANGVYVSFDYTEIIVRD